MSFYLYFIKWKFFYQPISNLSDLVIWLNVIWICNWKWLDWLIYFFRCDTVKGCVPGVGNFNTTASNGIYIYAHICNFNICIIMLYYTISDQSQFISMLNNIDDSCRRIFLGELFSMKLLRRIVRIITQ